MSEFSRTVDIRALPAKAETFTASAAECSALAKRFGLVSIGSLSATLELIADGPAVNVSGRLRAAVVQSCAVSGDDLPVAIDEPVSLRFVPAGGPSRPDEEVELAAADLDEVEYSGTQFDLGEELAQILAVSIDPYAEGPNAEAARAAAGLNDKAASGPFAALAALQKKED